MLFAGPGFGPPPKLIVAAGSPREPVHNWAFKPIEKNISSASSIVFVGLNFQMSFLTIKIKLFPLLLANQTMIIIPQQVLVQRQKIYICRLIFFYG